MVDALIFVQIDLKNEWFILFDGLIVRRLFLKSLLHFISDDFDLSQHLNALFSSLHIHMLTYENVHKFYTSYTNQLTGCILLDVNDSQINALEFLSELKKKGGMPLPVIIITDLNDIQVAIEAMKLGAKDFLLKPFNEQALIETVQINLHRKMGKIHEVSCKISTLTEREKQILNLILEGRMNKDIAQELTLSISTVEAHRRNMMKKLGAVGKAQLIKICLEAEMV